MSQYSHYPYKEFKLLRKWNGMDWQTADGWKQVLIIIPAEEFAMKKYEAGFILQRLPTQTSLVLFYFFKV